MSWRSFLKFQVRYKYVTLGVCMVFLSLFIIKIECWPLYWPKLFVTYFLVYLTLFSYVQRSVKQEQLISQKFSGCRLSFNWQVNPQEWEMFAKRELLNYYIFQQFKPRRHQQLLCDNSLQIFAVQSWCAVMNLNSQNKARLLSHLQKPWCLRTYFPHFMWRVVYTRNCSYVTTFSRFSRKS